MPLLILSQNLAILCTFDLVILTAAQRLGRVSQVLGFQRCRVGEAFQRGASDDRDRGK